MTAQFKAEGPGSTGRGSAGLGGTSVFHIGVTITEGLKAAVGRYLTVELGKNQVAFLLSSLCGYYPRAIIAAADILRDSGYTEYPGIGHYDRDQFDRSRRLSEAIVEAIKEDMI